MKFSALSVPVALSAVFLVSGCEKEKLNQVPIADAGSPLIVQLPESSVTVTGTGTDNDGKIVSYLWSEVSGPNVPVIENAGSASTLITGLQAGDYLFQLMVVDNEGATGMDTVSIRVTSADIEVLSVAPANNPNEVHMYGNANLDGSQAGAPEIGAVSWTHFGAQIGMRGALKFDLSDIPANATIISARLYLYSNPTPLNGGVPNANSGTNNAMLIQQITAPWSAAAVKWTNQPTTTTTNQILIPHTNAAYLDLDVDVKTQVQSMVANSSNYGFLVRLQTETPFNSRVFCSSFYSDANRHPKLVVEYSK
jgi:hypothetical protein